MKKVGADKTVFVEEYLRHGNQTKAALAAGYPKGSAQSMGTYLLKHDAMIIDAVRKARHALVVKGTYSLDKAMTETDSAIKFARETKNANALAKLIELRAKLNGLLVEKHDMRMVGFHVSVAGIDFAKRDGKTGDDDDGGDLF